MSWSMSGTITPATTLARRCSSSSRCSIIGSGCIRRSAMSARCSSKPTTLSPFEGVYGIGGSSACPLFLPEVDAGRVLEFRSCVGGRGVVQEECGRIGVGAGAVQEEVRRALRERGERCEEAGQQEDEPAKRGPECQPARREGRRGDHLSDLHEGGALRTDATESGGGRARLILPSAGAVKRNLQG